MKFSTLFSFVTLSGVVLAKTTSKNAQTATPTNSTVAKPTGTSDCEIVKDIFSNIKPSTYPWYDNIKNCCNSTKQFTCNKNNKIEKITLNKVKLNATFSEKFGSLTSLKQLSLADTGLYGNIPSSLYKIKDLEVLELNNNKLNGTLPKGVENLSKLKSLNLENNGLSGEIPESLFTIETLEDVNLSNNNVTGEIPEMKKRIKNM